MNESLRRIVKFAKAGADPMPTSGKEACNMYKKALEWSKKHPNPICFNRGRHKQSSGK